MAPGQLVHTIDIDTDRIDETVPALLYLTLHDGVRAWKRSDWEVMKRLNRNLPDPGWKMAPALEPVSAPLRPRTGRGAKYKQDAQGQVIRTLARPAAVHLSIRSCRP